MTRQIDLEGFKLLQGEEACRLESYKDARGIWTIGWGDTGPGIGPGLVWTQNQADVAFAARLVGFQDGVSFLVKVPISDNQFSALVSLAYNIGLGALKRSTLLSYLNAGQYDEASRQFLVWNEAGGKVLPDLIQRRAQERALFMLPDGGKNGPA